MEDWQQWQIRADEIASALNKDVDALEHDFFGTEKEVSFRAFWPRFRELKERVRVAPAIKLDDKLSLERRLRGLGSRAYKAQEATYAESGTRKNEFLSTIQALRERSESLETPRELRELRRELDGVRTQFDTGAGLVPPDRQAVWDAWRDTNQFVWQRLNDLWSQNETYLRDILAMGRQDMDRGDGQGARQAAGRFFEALRTHEAKQAAINVLKAEAEGLRREADEATMPRMPEPIMTEYAAPGRHASTRNAPTGEHRAQPRRSSERRGSEGRTRDYRNAEPRHADRRSAGEYRTTERRGAESASQPAYSTQQSTNAAPAVQGWRTEAERNRETMARLQSEIDVLDREFQSSESILEQAMIRGNLVDKRRKLSELERSTRTLEQRIEQAEDVPLIPVG